MRPKGYQLRKEVPYMSLTLNNIQKSDDGVYWSDNEIRLTNHAITIHKEIISEETGDKLIYVLEVIDNGHIVLHETFEKLDIDKIFKSVPFSAFNIDGTRARKTVLEKIIMAELEASKDKEVHKCFPGYYMLNGNLICVSEFKTYGDVGNIDIMSIHCNEMIPYTPSDEITNELEFIEKFISDKPAYAGFLVAALSSYTSPFLELKNIKQKICIVLIGSTGCGKTSYGKLLTTYEGITRGCSFCDDRKDFFKKLSSFRHCPILIEELNKTSSTEVKSRNEKIFSTMVQRYESNDTLNIDGKTLKFSATPVVTAEYMVKNPSTINRCLIVEFPNNFLPERLSWLQEHQEYYTVFLDKFIDWICGSYNQYKVLVPNWTFKPLNVEDEDSYNGSIHRTQNIYNILNMTVKIIMDYLKEVYKLPYPQMKKIGNSLQIGVDESICSTLKLLKQEEASAGTWYTNTILDYLMYNYKDVVAKNFEKYKNRPKKRKIFFETDGYICIAPDDITKCFNKDNNCKYIITKHAILSQLAEHGLIQSTARNNTHVVSINGKATPNRYVKIIKAEFQRMVTERRINLFGYYIPSSNFWEDLRS